MPDQLSFIRLEPRPSVCDLEAGFVAAVHDPVWFVGRQWQMGEHQGENASSPVWVTYDLEAAPIVGPPGSADPAHVPAEAIVESESDDWWTMGRRIRVGRRLQASRAQQINAFDPLYAVRLHSPAPPYERFDGWFDGMALWRYRHRMLLSDEDFGADRPPPEIPSAWRGDALLYEQEESNAFRTSSHRLVTKRHRGGTMDWYSVDASAPGNGPDPPGPTTSTRTAIPLALQYPGAPNPRWWQFETSEADFAGGHVPDTSHTVTALLTDVIHSHGDDWYLFPVDASAGHVVTMTRVVVRDSFDREYTSDPPDAPAWNGLQPPEDWSVFQVEGLPRNALVLWHVAEAPLESLPIERVQFGRDETSNLVWAVERILDGREVESRTSDVPTTNGENKDINPGTPAGDARKPREYAYVPARGVIRHWHPYTVCADSPPRCLEQRILLDMSTCNFTPMPAPKAQVLQSQSTDPHRILLSAIPGSGVDVERRWQLARDVWGNPILWIQRQRRALLAPPGRNLRFDVMEQARNQEAS